MNYELGKYLKEAGYPQNIKRGYLLMSEMQDEPVYIPELEELIQECSPEFESLHKVQGEEDIFWRVLPKDIKLHNTTTGETPKVALAMFYLEIHKNV